MFKKQSDSNIHSDLNIKKILLMLLCVFIPSAIFNSIKIIGFYPGGLLTILLYAPFLFLAKKIYKSNIGEKPRDTLIIAPLSESLEDSTPTPSLSPHDESRNSDYCMEQLHSLQQKVKVCIIITIASLITAISAIIIPNTYFNKTELKLAEVEDELTSIHEELSSMSRDISSHHVHIGLLEMSLEGIDLNYLDYRIRKIENYLDLY